MIRPINITKHPAGAQKRPITIGIVRIPPINRTLPTIRVFVLAIINPADGGIFAYRADFWKGLHGNNATMYKGLNIFSISHACQNDGLRNLTEAVVQSVFHEHTPMDLGYASYPREVCAFLRLSIYHWPLPHLDKH